MTADLITHIMQHVDRSGGPEACHPWTGPISKGQPRLWHGDTSHAPRRTLYQHFHNVTLPTSQRVFDHCRNLLCCNPRHLAGGDLYSRVLDRVDSSGGPDACWPFRGHLSKGYGRIRLGHNGRRHFAHRVMWERANGRKLRDDELCLHSCDNAQCCNPRHLRPGTDAENKADMDARGRRAGGEKHAETMRRAREMKAAGYERVKKRGGRRPKVAA